MKHAVRQIILLAAVLIVLCVGLRLLGFNAYPVHMPLTESIRVLWEQGKAHALVRDPAMAHLGEPSLVNGSLRVPVFPDKAGDLQIGVADEKGELMSIYYLRVSPLGTVIDYQTSGFTGDTVILVACCIFWLAVSAIMLYHFFRARGVDFYQYTTIYFSGFSIFALVTGLYLSYVTARHIADPVRFSMLSCYGAINNASTYFMMITMPLVILFAFAMAVSNTELLRHEGYRFQNVLGLLVSFGLIAGEAVGYFLYSKDFSGSETQKRIHDILINTYATVFVYFECMLAGSVICGIRAAVHEPKPDKDFIVILGCWFRRDGSLPPLLRGRVDRAIAFWRRQKELTGREAVFIPSGGQGKNETMPEAEAMRRYLIQNNIPEDKILPETRSANTYENMAFSKKILESVSLDGKAIFATTNYHVFRSGVWAAKAGLSAEGIGGKTKWWFWPNAFMRECAGLLRSRWKEELFLLALFIGYFVLLAVLLN